MTKKLLVGLAALAVSSVGWAQTPPVPGDPKTPKTMALEAGAKVLQSNTPLKPFDVYIVGFHPMKEQPEHQMEAHHYCHQVNEDFAQCALFDSSTKNARLNGVEYIISEKLFATLPAEERAFWHPHNGEILSGQLIAPGIPAAAEKALMRQKMNSYGKTWHLWNTGHEGMAADQLPLGPAKLAWSFSRDGEAIPAMIERRDRRMDVSTAKKRQQRADLQQLAKPQDGVDALKGKFGRPTTDIPGVRAATAGGNP
ncbi:OBAP family protein [Massilia sp. PAMC28688]|uniref:OBAP family protein n=1 Tax=Massilia sp. PAMC28688 TaxID=2861283 RepID=UPI001C62B779|nr:OBAP family protein [Massilia sp. PAMC28688]QYF92235.1 OBAP family protein [Massilia sp. PAMC28688]